MQVLKDQTPVEHFVAELVPAPAQAIVPDGAIYFAARPDFLVVPKPGTAVILDQTARVSVTTDDFGQKTFVLAEDARATADVEFGDPSDGTVFSIDSAPLRVRAGTQLEFLHSDPYTLNQAA